MEKFDINADLVFMLSNLISAKCKVLLEDTQNIIYAALTFQLTMMAVAI